MNIGLVKCPECDADIKIPDDSIEGEIITCPDCGASFELVKTNEGFNIKPAQVVGEDWGEGDLVTNFGCDLTTDS